MKYYQELDNDQRRVFLDNAQLYDAFVSVARDLRQYRGGMSWQTVSGKEYLVRVLDNRTKKSVGPRSPQAENILLQFWQGKQDAIQRKEGIEARLQRQSKVCRAMNLGRIPRLTGNILRVLAEFSLDRKTTTVIGTNALYAYESMAGVQFTSDLLATNDLDILWDARSKLKIASDIPAEGLIALLKKVDKSFTVLDKAKYRAINRDGYMVDLLRESVDMRIEPEPSFASSDDFVAVEADMKWLIASPKVRAVVMDEDGYPVPVSAPDPRAFAIHKFWLSSRRDRDPIKKPRDAAQSAAVLSLVEDLLPQYPFSEKALRVFPKVLFARFLPASVGNVDALPNEAVAEAEKVEQEARDDRGRRDV